MKYRILSLVLCAALILFAFVHGALRGWQQDYAQVESTFSSLRAHLGTRVETACNILTVARRHLPKEDERMAALQRTKDELSAAQLNTQFAANSRLDAEAREILSALAELQSVQDDPRDLMYVSSMLPQMLQESAAQSAQSAYHAAALDFNARFEKNKVSSFIVRLFGIDAFDVLPDTL